jgi:hypothetical protein
MSHSQLERPAQQRWLTSQSIFPGCAFAVAFALLIAAFGPARAYAAQPGPAPQALRCDDMVNPVGIGSAHPRFHWALAVQGTQRRGVRQSAYEIVVAMSRAALAKDQGDAWDSGKTAAALAPLVDYSGPPLLSDTVYFWKVKIWDGDGRPSAWSDAAKFTTGILSPAEWKAKWIAARPDAPPSPREDEDTPMAAVPPLPILRHGFAVAKPLARATLFVSGLGEGETFLNGEPVTSAVLTPGWSQYRKTVLYDAYDVTPQLRQGENAIAVMLGNGMYNVEGVKGRYTKFAGSFGQPKLIAELHLHYADGSVETIASGEGWRVAEGPVRFSSIYGGEDYDARMAPPGWMRAGFDDSGWKAAVAVAGPGGALRAEELPPVEVAHTYGPVKLVHVSDTVTLYDFGQNFAGRPEIAVHGTAGSHVRILPGELLDASGRVSQHSTAVSPDAPVLFNYTLRGGGEEKWAPTFSYWGFRYVELEVTGKVTVDRVVGQGIHGNVAIDGSFSSSDEMLDRIHALIDAAMINNIVSVLTDCPTREKLGWLEQTHLAGTSLMYNYGLSLLYRKMAMDMRDSQLSDGMVPSIAPEVVTFSGSFRDSPEWGSAIILSPWTAYTFYGDAQLLRDNYAAMVAYANYLQTKSHDNLLGYGLGDWYDIGPGEPGESKLTGKQVTATATYYEDLTVLARIATLLQRPEDVVEFQKRAAAVKASFNAHLFHRDTMTYDRGSQTANAMALALGLVPEDARSGVMETLVKDIHAHGDHVTVGDVGYHYLVRALTDGGRSDVLYAMLLRTDSPSYGYQLKQGATALTEAWDANPASSQDHFMLGHAEEWFYRGLAGIDFDLSRNTDKRIWIHPRFVEGVTSAGAEYDSVLGKVASHWRLRGNELQMDISVPPGASATVTLPEGFRRDVQESGRSLKGIAGVLSVAEDGGTCIVGSGEYHFTVRR